MPENYFGILTRSSVLAWQPGALGTLGHNNIRSSRPASTSQLVEINKPLNRLTTRSAAAGASFVPDRAATAATCPEWFAGL